MITIVALSWLLIRREKALQYAIFSASPTGIKFTFELDRDKKMELLLNENLVLKKQNEILQQQNKASTWRLAMLVFKFILIILTLRYYLGPCLNGKQRKLSPLRLN